MSTPRPLALLTNDDGIECAFLAVLAEAAARHFRVAVAAPAAEQSWIGRAVSRRKPVPVRPAQGFPGPAWAVDGTPTDCVNVALGHLLAERPAVVLSGINVGYNTSLPLIFCSGTVAAALEGAAWGVRAVAVSQSLPEEWFDAVKTDYRRLPEPMVPWLRAAAEKAVTVAVALLEQPAQRLTVHNLNFPPRTAASTPLVPTVPGDLDLGCLFEEEPGQPGEASGVKVFQFRYRQGVDLPNRYDLPTDRAVLAAGQASHSVIDFGRLAGRD